MGGWEIGFALYAIGAAITAGFIGGVRDEMEGIADLAIILLWLLLWPVALVIWGFVKGLKLAYAIGQRFNSKRD